MTALLLLARCGPAEGTYFRCEEREVCLQEDPAGRAYVCLEGFCHPPNEVPDPVDAGGDAGVDGGAGDAGPDDPDGGATEPDGGQPDAGGSVPFTALPNAGARCFAGGFCYENPRFGGSNLHGVWGNAADEVFIVGNHGLMLFWDGADFRRVATGVTHHLLDVWSGPDTLVAAGASGTLLEWSDGALVSQDFIALPLHSVSGFGDTAAVAGLSVFGERYPESGGWNPATSWTGNHRGVWGYGPRQYWMIATPTHELVQVVDGVVVNRVDAGLDGEFLSDLDGLGPAHAVAVGHNGQRVVFDGGTWTSAPTGVTDSLRGVKVFTDGGWITTGSPHRILYTSGPSTAVVQSGTAQPLSAVWGAAPDDAWAVGAGGAIVRNESGNWVEVPGFRTPNFVDVGVGTGGRPWALAKDGTLYTRGVDGRWVAVIPTGAPAEAMHVAGNFAWTVSTDGVIRRITLSTGDTATEHTDSSGATFRAIWGDETSARHVVGSGGRVLTRVSATQWDATTVLTNPDLHAIGGVGGELWTGGAVGAAFRLEAGVWTPHPITGTSGTVTGVWATDAGFAAAVTHEGELATWNGAAWSRSTVSQDRALRAIDGKSAAAFWLVGDLGTVVEVSDGSPTLRPVASDSSFTSVVYGPDAGVFIAGERGGLLRRP